MAILIELGQVGQLRNGKKAYETGNSANLANFFSMFAMKLWRGLAGFKDRPTLRDDDSD